MSSEKPTDARPANGDESAEGEDAPQGVFGNLPQTRPGARSPRRDATAKRARGGAAAAKHKAAAARPKAARPKAPGAGSGRGQTPLPTEDAARALADSKAPSDPGQAEPGEPDGSQGGGLEDVAWAGVAAAAEAATIGVRLATRALEAMRDAVDRR